MDLITAPDHIMTIIIAFPAARVQADAAMRSEGGAGAAARAAVTVEAGVGRAIHMIVDGEKNTSTGIDTRGNTVVEAAVAIEIERRSTTNIDIQGKVTNIVASIQTKIDTIIENTKNEIGEFRVTSLSTNKLITVFRHALKHQQDIETTPSFPSPVPVITTGILTTTPSFPPRVGLAMTSMLLAVPFTSTVALSNFFPSGKYR